MRLDYKSIITKHYLLHLSGKDIADQIGASKSGVNGFLKAFEQAKGISYPLPPGITNEGIEALVYPSATASHARDESYRLPDFGESMIVSARIPDLRHTHTGSTAHCFQNGVSRMTWHSQCRYIAGSQWK